MSVTTTVCKLARQDGSPSYKRKMDLRPAPSQDLVWEAIITGDMERFQDLLGIAPRRVSSLAASR